MRELRQSVLISLLGLLVGFVLAEGAWRVYLFRFASQRHFEKWGRMEDLPPDLLKYRPHPYMAYCLNPDYRSRDGRNRHNSLGFRGAEIEKEKPSGIYRIACIGASTTYDVKIEDYRHTYPAQLEAVLRDVYGHEQVEVINAGVGGYNSWESLVNLQFRVLDLDPDLIIVYHATNDVHARLVPPPAYRRDDTGHRRAWTEELHWWDRSLLLHYFGVQWGFSQRNTLQDRVQVQYDREFDLEANPPSYFKTNLEDMVALAKYHGVAILLTSWAHCPSKGDYASTPTYERGFREHIDVTRQVAAQNAVPFYDFASEMTADPEYWADGVHNNERGARRKAELFAAFVHEHFLSR